MESLRCQTRKAEEILVVNDGSTDTTQQIAEANGVRVLDHKKNLGLGRARNTAIQHATGEIIVFFDADTLLYPTLLEEILSEYANPETIGVGGQEFFAPLPGRVNLWRNLFWRQTHGEERIEDASMLMGLCSSYRKEVLLEVGGFDTYFTSNGEDVDMGIRVRKAGYRLVYVPRIGVFHRRTDSLKSLLSLVYRHAFWQSRAFRRNGIHPYFQMKTSIRWLFISMGSSIRRHRDFFLVMISLIAGLTALIGRSIESFCTGSRFR